MYANSCQLKIEQDKIKLKQNKTFTNHKYKLKALYTLSDTTVRKCTVDQEDLKPYWKTEKMSDFSRSSTSLLFTSFSKNLQTRERRLTGQMY